MPVWAALYPPAGVVKADYKNASRAWVLARHPAMGAARVEELAKEEFEAAARQFFEQTLQTCKGLRPKASWGFYGYPSCGKWRHEAVCPVVGKGGGKNVTDQLAWLWRASDALYPGIYLCCASDRSSRNQSFVAAEMAESHRALAVAGVDRPVVPYVWPDWEDRPGERMGPDTLETGSNR